MRNYIWILKQLMIDYLSNLKIQKPSTRPPTVELRKLEAAPKDMVLKTQHRRKRRVSWLISQIASKDWNHIPYCNSQLKDLIIVKLTKTETPKWLSRPWSREEIKWPKNMMEQHHIYLKSTSTKICRTMVNFRMRMVQKSLGMILLSLTLILQVPWESKY